MIFATVLSSTLLLSPTGRTQAAPLDTLVDAGGYRMHLMVYRGTKPLTIVMEVGGGAPLKGWAGVESEVAARTGATVVVYDRAGFGQSELGPMDLTPRRQVDQLDRVLELLHLPSSRIVMGHSYGGVLAVVHAHLFPKKVRGLVLVDPMNQRFVQSTGDMVYSTVPKIEHPASTRDSALVRMVKTFGSLVNDPTAADRDLKVPIVVISAGEPFWGKTPDIDRAWRASHAAIAQAGSGRRLIVADGSKHDIPAKRPDTIVDAAVSLVQAIAAGG
jgi:pimeloyl-ACP methyl ester carboxylesterase